MEVLQKIFSDREQLLTYVKSITPWAEGNASVYIGGRSEAEIKLKNIDPINYAKTRNFGNGHVSMLSPFLHHGILSLNEVRNYALSCCEKPEQATKFIKELAWRDFWQRISEKNPFWIWNDVEPYKTGFLAEDYSNNLPEDILKGNTGTACIDSFINDLIKTGYVHNHARMYIASYIVHFRRIKWQVGAEWFLKHLLDGDEASNNLSWQWVASTFSNKPYIFNLENVDKYFGELVDTSYKKNEILNASYDTLSARLFPKMRMNNVQ